MRIGSGFSKDGLIFHVDAGNPKSYPGSGTTWYDLSGNGLDVTINGASWDSTGFFTTTTFNELYISGSDATLLDFEYNDPMTLICIASIPADNTGAWMSKMAEDKAGAGYWRGWDLWTTSSPGGSVGQHNINQWSVKAHRRRGTWTGRSNINDGIHMACTTYDGSAVGTGITSYLDGVPADTYDILTYGTLDATMIDTGTHFTIGSRDGVQELAGNYYMCSIYNRELSVDEIREYYNSFKARFGI